MQNSSLNTVELNSQDFDRAADLLAEAFFNNPAHKYIFPKESTRLEALRWLMKRNLNLQNSIGRSFALVEPDKNLDGRQIKAMGFWHPPHSGSINFLSMVKEGLLTMPFKFGWNEFKQLLEVLGKLDKIKYRAIGESPVWYLNNMVVAKELRGSGIGTKVLEEKLQTVVTPSGFPAILMTQREQNVKFYTKLGFEIAIALTIGVGDYAFTNWCMVKNN